MLTQITLLVVVALASSHPTYPAAPAPPQTDSGYYTSYQQPQAAPEPEINIDYKMSMAVQDDETANYQTREESKEGKIIKGSYTVLEPTGELRVVTYIADENGFQADVQNKAPAAPAYKPHYPSNDHYAPATAPKTYVPLAAPLKTAPKPTLLLFKSEPKPAVSPPEPEYRPKDAGGYYQIEQTEGHGY